MNETCPRGDFETLVRDFLPEGYEYKVESCKVLDDNSQNPKFCVEVRVNVDTDNGVQSFLANFNTSSGCTFNIQSGRQDKRQDSDTSRSRYRGFRKCCMNVCHTEGKENRQPGKNVDCKASLNFRLENPVARCKNVKEDRQKFPLWIKVDYQHNHALDRADYLRFLSVSQVTKNIYFEMFHNGLSAGSAQEERRTQLKTAFPDTWPTVCADNSQLPNILTVYYLHRKWTDDNLGSGDGIDAFEKAKKLIDDFNSECLKDTPLSENQCFAKIAQNIKGETVVAIVDGFMRRVHEKVPQSGELCLIDATSNLDRYDSKVFHIVCPSPVGSLPLATLITTREDTETVLFALELLKSVLPSYAFYGRGTSVGPHVIMTDDCEAEKKALAAAWPSSTLLLCIFHTLQAQWQWLWDQTHGVEHKDKPVLLNLFRGVLYADTVEERAERLEEIYAHPTALKYPLYQRHLIKDTFPKMNEWSIARRVLERLPTSNNNTTNLVECSFRYTKDIQFNRLRAFNLPDLLSLVLDNSQFYSNKCLDAANNRIETWLRNCHSKYVIKMPDIDVNNIVELGQNCFMVPSENSPDVSYVVDMSSRTCSCPQGRLHGPCKHKLIVSHSKNIPSFDLIPTKSPQIRQIFMYIATGKMMGLNWFLPLQAISPEQDEASLLGLPITTSPNLSSSNNGPAEVVNMDAEEGTEVETEIAQTKLKNVLAKLINKIMPRIGEDPVGYNKSLDILEKTVDSLPATVDSALQKCLCTFGKTVTQV